MRYLLLCAVVLFTLGMATPPPKPVCHDDPILNSQVINAINSQCSKECLNKNSDCMNDCTEFSKWGIKFGEDK